MVFLICIGGWTFFGAAFPQTGWDFSQFYIAGALPYDQLYDRAAYEAYANEELAPQGVEYFPPYVRPAVFATPLKALALLSYPAAMAAFFLFQFALFCGSLYLVMRRFDLPVDLLPLFALFYPAMMGIITGQDGHTLALLTLGGFLLLERKRDVQGAILWGLCAYKFNLILWLPLLLLVKGRFKALASMGATGLSLAVASALLAPPGQYLELLRNIESHTVGFFVTNMISMRSLAVAAGIESAFPLLAIALTAAGVIPLRRLPFERGYALAITGSILCAYHVGRYDAVLLLPVFALILSSGPMLGKLLTVCLIVAFPIWVKPMWVAGILVALWFVQVWPLLRPVTSPDPLEASPAGVESGLP